MAQFVKQHLEGHQHRTLRLLGFVRDGNIPRRFISLGDVLEFAVTDPEASTAVLRGSTEDVITVEDTGYYRITIPGSQMTMPAGLYSIEVVLRSSGGDSDSIAEYDLTIKPSVIS